MAAPKSDPVPGSLASRILKLIDLKRKRDTGDTYTQLEIAQECSRLYVESKISELTSAWEGEEGQKAYKDAVASLRSEKPLLNRAYVSDLCTGRRINPTKDVIEALAGFFGVSPDYFFSGVAATAKTQATADEVEVMMLARDLKRHLEGNGQEQGGEVLAQLMRGGGELTADMAMGMLRMLSATIAAAREGDQ